MRVLIVEDERTSLRQLADAVTRLRPDAVVDEATDYETAIAAITATAYDLIFSDLLLLPPGVAYDVGFLRFDDGTERLMQPEDWHQYTVAEGGVEIVRRLRTLVGPNTHTPVVIMTWFVEQDGFERITRRLSRDDDPKLVMFPKISRVDELVESLPQALADHGPWLQGELEYLLKCCLRVPWTLNDGLELRRAAAQFRTSFAVTKEKRDLARSGLYVMAPGGGGWYEPQAPVACTLTLTIDPSNDLETFVKLLGSSESDGPELADLYDDWPTLRDWVLLNPNIDLEVGLAVKLVGDGRDPKPHEVPLTKYTTGPASTWGEGREAERRLMSLLAERLILTYLAAQTEPPQATQEGWAITLRGLGRLADDPVADRQPPWARQAGWGASGTDPDVPALLAEIGRGARMTDHLTDLGNAIDARTRGAYFRPQAVLSKLPQQRGWYFNGSLSLTLPPEAWHAPNEYEAQRVAFFPLADSVPFACLNGRMASPDELELRFREAGMSVERFGSLAEVERIADRMPDATLAVVAPVDDDLLDSFIGGEAFETWQRVPLAERPFTILVLTDDVTVRSPEEMALLRGAGIDCMYPSRVPGALDLTKIMDHVICAGYRTRYESVQLSNDDPEARAESREVLSGLFGFARENGYDGDSLSGAASLLLPNGDLAVTASKTEKRSSDPADVALVHDVDVVRNRVEWSGVKKPSSSTRWHSLIYQAIPTARVILHTHWKALTYSGALGEFATSQYRLSGSRQEAAEIVCALTRNGNDGQFAILRDHGEVFVGTSVADLEDVVGRTLEQADVHARI
jgi:CheY-like chemotaxis protein